MDEAEVSSWAEEMVEVFDLPSDLLETGRINHEDPEWLSKRLNEIDTSKVSLSLPHLRTRSLETHQSRRYRLYQRQKISTMSSERDGKQ